MTTPGIGASSILGVAFELASPPLLQSVTPTNGGALTAGAYRYAITTVTQQGETLISNEIIGTTAGANLQNVVTWLAAPGAIGYNIYRSAAGGAAGSERLLASVGASVLTYTDGAVGVTTSVIPVANTGYAAGVYNAPTKFVPYLTEGLVYQQDTQWRRPIRNTPGLVGAVPGNSHVEGDLELEALCDTILYFLAVSRCTFVKTGAGPYTYTYTPSAVAVPQRTLSITLVRNGQVFGYTGCVVGDFKFTIDNGQLKMTASIIGMDEATQSVPTPVWPTSTPFGAGSYSYQIPTANQIYDADSFEFESNDNGTPNYRIKNTGRGAQFISFGESDSTLKVDRDFVTRADYDAFKALTSQSITLQAVKGSESVTILMPVGFKDTYEVTIGAQGDLVRATINYQNAIDTTGKHYQVSVVALTENIS